MQKYIPKTDQDNGRNNSRRNYEDSRAIRKRSSQEQRTYENVREREENSKSNTGSGSQRKKRKKSKTIKQYAEIKMMKGHSEEQALKMAEEQITTKEW